jgi:NAD(P)-dependent dehydrogenase (short-subunit alcohol dehydrogenase family)
MTETEDEEFDNVLNVNLRGVWNCMKAELRQMMAQGAVQSSTVRRLAE